MVSRIRELDATAHPPLLHNHLMSECRLLGLFELSGEVSRLSKRSSAIIAAEVRQSIRMRMGTDGSVRLNGSRRSTAKIVRASIP